MTDSGNHRSYRADLIVEARVFLELTSVERVLPVHAVQTLTYLRWSTCEAAPRSSTPSIAQQYPGRRRRNLP